jgi:phosphoenolpyruvate-protein phosphotransferase (PTS system enzyme I)
MSLRPAKKTTRVERILKGIAASPGVAFGHAVTAWDPELVTLNYTLEPEEIAPHIESFRTSVEKSRRQLRKMQGELDSSAGDSTTLIDAHLLILEDSMFIDRIVDKIQGDRMNSEWAIQAVSGSILEAYDRVHDDYLRDRRGDLEDVVRRLLFNLRSYEPPTFRSLRYHSILVGKMILPSTLLELKSPRLVGVVTETGSPLSHTAIIARSMEVPVVMGVADVLPGLISGELIVVDGDEGVVIRAPSDETLGDYRKRLKRVEQSRRRLARAIHAPCVTKDRISILLASNINFKDEAAAVVANECEAIGLYRTEFDFFREGAPLSERELVADYSQVLSAAQGLPVNIRVIDVGMREGKEGAPERVGPRGLRFLLEHRPLFRRQLRAIYRASPRGHARIVLPFVSTLDELAEARRIIEGVRQGLTKKGIAFDETVPVGIMIETPAAAQTADLMASEVDFICLGTNDLIQYSLAIDRTERVSMDLYNPFHPAVLRMLKLVHDLVEPTGKTVVVCGELAADPHSAAVLLGLGFSALSVPVGAYGRVKRLIRSVVLSELRELTSELLTLRDRDEIERRVREALA